MASCYQHHFYLLYPPQQGMVWAQRITLSLLITCHEHLVAYRSGRDATKHLPSGLWQAPQLPSFGHFLQPQVMPAGTAAFGTASWYGALDPLSRSLHEANLATHVWSYNQAFRTAPAASQGLLDFASFSNSSQPPLFGDTANMLSLLFDPSGKSALAVPCKNTHVVSWSFTASQPLEFYLLLHSVCHSRSASHRHVCPSSPANSKWLGSASSQPPTIVDEEFPNSQCLCKGCTVLLSITDRHV